MPLVKGQCVNCGAILELDFNTKSGVCRHCGTPYISEDVINNYVTNHHYHIENANIEMVDESSSKKLLENAEVNFTQLGNYHKAKELFTDVTEKSPGDYRGWWGLVRVDTDNFSDFKMGKNRLNKIEVNVSNAIKVAPVEIKTELKRVWNLYNSKFCDYITKTHINTIENNNLEIGKLNDMINPISKKLNQYQEQKNKLVKAKNELLEKNQEKYSRERSENLTILYSAFIGVVLIMCVFSPILFLVWIPILAIFPIVRKRNKTKYEFSLTEKEMRINEIDIKIKICKDKISNLEKKKSDCNSYISKAEHSIEYGD